MAGLGDVVGGIGGAAGGIYNLARGNKGLGIENERRALELIMGIQDLKLDPTQLPYEDRQLVAEYFPEQAKAIFPDMVNLAQDSAQGRGTQVRSLAQLEDIGANGLPLLDRINANEAGRAISGELARNTAYGARELAQKGRLGAGEEAIMRSQAGQDQMDLAGRLGSDIARQSIAQRMAGITGAADLGGALRGQDIGLSQYNANAANQFNAMTTGRQNEAEQAAVAARNAGQLYRVGEQQRIAEGNAAGRQEQNRYNLERENQRRITEAEFERQRREEQAQAQLTQANRKAQREYARRAQIVGLGQSAGKAVGGIGDLGLAGL